MKHLPRSSMLGLICVMLILTFSTPATASTTKHLTHVQWREKVVSQLQLFAKIGSKIYAGERLGKVKLFEQGCVEAALQFAQLPSLQMDGAPDFQLMALYGNWWMETLSVGRDCLSINLDTGPLKTSLTKDLATEFDDLQKAQSEGNQLWRAVVK